MKKTLGVFQKLEYYLPLVAMRTLDFFLCTTAVARRSDTIRPGGPTRSSADVSVPRRRYVRRPNGFSLIT